VRRDRWPWAKRWQQRASTRPGPSQPASTQPALTEWAATWRWRASTWVQRLPKRWHGITQELAKFGTIGAINLVVNFAVFNLLFLTVLRGGELKAKAVAAIVATTCAYFMNRHWTYRDRPKSTLRREYSLFFFFNLVGMAIEVAVVGITKYGLHETHIIALNISTAIGIGLGTLFRFWAYRTHVFKLDSLDVPTFDQGLPDLGRTAERATGRGPAERVLAPPDIHDLNSHDQAAAVRPTAARP
jgi:putative flippase GtrA